MKPYKQPLFYSIAAIGGLVLALLSDGVGDVIGLVLLTAPLYPLVRPLLQRR